MRNSLKIGIALLWAALAAPAAADQRAVVVELFTSQGCSSCPPADALLAELGQSAEVIPLALHVDYWDYIGWKDRYASPDFTRRQKGYARANGWNKVYPPQMVVNGTTDVIGSNPMKVMRALDAHADAPETVRLTIRRNGGTLHLRAEALRDGLRPCDIHLVRYRPAAETAIERGENAGRTLSYSHIVTRWEAVAQWDGTGIFETSLPVSGDEPVVVLVQQTRFGPILAAARLR